MIHPSAMIDPTAELANDVEVGPYAVIGPDVCIEAGTRIGPHCVLRGPARIGRDNHIFQFASLGEDPQDRKYAGERTFLEIGDRNQIREFTTIHRGTVQDQGLTRIGNDNLLMAYTHVAHDCRIGDHVIMSNAASLGGHVEVQDWAILGGFTLVHQFSRIGAHAFSGMNTVINRDVPPFVLVSGQPAAPHGLNTEGLRRRGFPRAEVALLKRAYRTLYREGLPHAEALVAVAQLAAESPSVNLFHAFLGQCQRGYVRERDGRGTPLG